MTQPQPDSYSAVDRAIAKAKAFCERYPARQVILEAIPSDQIEEAVQLIGGGPALCEVHKLTFAAWDEQAAAPAGHIGSSFEYFLRRYWSLTWLIDPDVPAEDIAFPLDGDPTLGVSVLEIADDFRVDVELELQLSERWLPEQTRVFHGGWTGPGFAMDTSRADADGEHPIYPFNVDHPLEHPAPTAAIQPFGFWLEERVNRIIDVLAPNLAVTESFTRTIKDIKRADEG